MYEEFYCALATTCLSKERRSISLQEGSTSRQGMHTGILHALNAHLASAMWCTTLTSTSTVWQLMATNGAVMVRQICLRQTDHSELYTGLCKQSHQIPQTLLPGAHGISRTRPIPNSILTMDWKQSVTLFAVGTLRKLQEQRLCLHQMSIPSLTMCSINVQKQNELEKATLISL